MVVHMPTHTHLHQGCPLLGHPCPKKGQKHTLLVLTLSCSFSWLRIATYELKHHPKVDTMDLLFCAVCRTVISNLTKMCLGLFKTSCRFALNLATHSEGTEATAYSPGWLWPFVIASTHNEIKAAWGVKSRAITQASGNCASQQLINNPKTAGFQTKAIAPE